VRGGYIRGYDDFDERTARNERITNTATVGFGLTPAGATWKVDASYALEWWQADYGDPVKPRGTHQLISAEIGWQF
jgi:fatty-acid desaturase